MPKSNRVLTFLLAPVLSLALTVPTGALALSCMPYNAIAAFKDAARASSDYVAVHGRLSFQESKLPKASWTRNNSTPPQTLITGQLTGHSLSKAGFKTPFQKKIRISVECMGPWCATLESGEDYLAFLKRDNGTYLLETNPCSGFAFARPTTETLGKVTACMQGKTCDAELPRRR